MRISDWSSDVCSSDLFSFFPAVFSGHVQASQTPDLVNSCRNVAAAAEPARRIWLERDLLAYEMHRTLGASSEHLRLYRANLTETCMRVAHNNAVYRRHRVRATRSEEHTSELQSLMRISYAGFCLKKKK